MYILQKKIIYIINHGNCKLQRKVHYFIFLSYLKNKLVYIYQKNLLCTHLPDGRSYPIFYHKSITVDDTEKLCYPKGRTFIGGQSIASTFLCSSAVCLLIGWNVKFFFRIFNFEDLQNWRIWCKKISKNNFWK